MKTSSGFHILVVHFSDVLCLRLYLWELDCFYTTLLAKEVEKEVLLMELSSSRSCLLVWHVYDKLVWERKVLVIIELVLWELLY